MDVAEAAVGEDGDDVVRAQLGDQRGDDGVGVVEVVRGAAGGGDVSDEFFRREALVGGEFFEAVDFADEDAVGFGEGGGEFFLEDAAAGGVAARLEDGPESPAGETDAEGAEGFAEGGRVMAEVVHDGDARGFAADFLPALDAAEFGEGGLDLFRREAVVE